MTMSFLFIMVTIMSVPTSKNRLIIISPRGFGGANSTKIVNNYLAISKGNFTLWTRKSLKTFLPDLKEIEAFNSPRRMLKTIKASNIVPSADKLKEN